MARRQAGSDRRAQWQARLRRFERSGQSVAEFCKAESISAWSLYDWRRKLRASSRGGRAAHAPAADFVDAGTMHVALPDEGGAAKDVEPPSGFELRIELGGAMVLRILRR
jgi:transposase-like protein